MIRIPGIIPITIHPFFWIVAGLIGWFNSGSINGMLIWVGLILFSVLVHELGHALTAMAWGQKAAIELIGFGGVTQRTGGRMKLWKECMIIANGPLAGFLLCLAALYLSNFLYTTHPHSPLVGWLFIAFYVNLFWTILNLLPIQPLDGGKLLSMVLEFFFGLKGVKTSLFISILVSGAASLFFFSYQAFLAGALFFLLAFESWQSWRSSLSVSEDDRDLALQQLLKEGQKELSLGRTKEALSTFIKIRELSESGVIFLAASENAAQILADEGEVTASYQLLAPLRAKLSPQGLKLLHQLAYRQQLWDEAISLGTRVYQESPDYEIALMNAMAHSLLGQARPAIGWLLRTIRDGVPNVEQILSRKEFDPIRTDPLFPCV
jgi:Zn-dependent protease